MIATQEVDMKMTAKEFYEMYSEDDNAMELWYKALFKYEEFRDFDDTEPFYFEPWEHKKDFQLHGDDIEAMAENYIEDYDILKKLRSFSPYNFSSNYDVYC